MIEAISKVLIYGIAGLILVGLTSWMIVPLLLFLLCAGWLIKNRHNLTTVEPEGNDDQ